ncbi:MAG: alkaline phosphatase family protein [Acidimicrobiales bacterium]
MPTPGNVLFITVDQWRGDCLSAAGHPVVRTPNLDRLAASGAMFTNHWAQAAPCGPSRACLYTGTYQSQNRSVLNGTPLDARLTNVALEARAAGLDPVLFGYTDSSVDPRTVEPGDPRLLTYEGVLPGMRAVLDFPFEPLTPWIDHLYALGYPRQKRAHDIFRADRSFPGAADHAPTWAPPIYAAEHSETAFLTDELLAWLDGAGTTTSRGSERRDPSGPWFAHLSYLRPHPPYRVAAPYHDLYDPAEVPFPVRAPTRELEGSQHRLAELAVGVVGAPDDEADMRQIRATYYGLMSEVDHHLGRVLDWLDTSGQAGDTLVVLTSDHGDQLGDHWLMEKLGYWDESYHVPMIVRDPRTAPAPAGPVGSAGPAGSAGSVGRRIDAFTEHVDVMPTILDWLGLDIPAQCDGRSLMPFVAGDGRPPGWRSEVHWQWDFRSPTTHVAEDLLGLTMDECTLDVIRDHRWKYVHMAGMAPLLFDLEADPNQFVDRSTDPACAPVVAAYAQKLLSWHQRHADRTLAGTLLTHDGPVARVDPRIG